MNYEAVAEVMADRTAADYAADLRKNNVAESAVWKRRRKVCVAANEIAAHLERLAWYEDGCPTCHGTLRTYSGTELHSLEQAIALQADGPCLDCPAGRLAEWDYMIDRMNWLDDLAVLARCAEEHRPYNRDRLLELLRLVPDKVRPPYPGNIR